MVSPTERDMMKRNKGGFVFPQDEKAEMKGSEHYTKTPDKYEAPQIESITVEYVADNSEKTIDNTLSKVEEASKDGDEDQKDGDEDQKDGDEDQTIEAEQYVAVTVARAVAEAEAESLE